MGMTMAAAGRIGAAVRMVGISWFAGIDCAVSARVDGQSIAAGPRARPRLWRILFLPVPWPDH